MNIDGEMEDLEMKVMDVPPLLLGSLVSLHSFTYIENEVSDRSNGTGRSRASWEEGREQGKLREGRWEDKEKDRDTKAGNETEADSERLRAQREIRVQTEIRQQENENKDYNKTNHEKQDEINQQKEDNGEEADDEDDEDESRYNDENNDKSSDTYDSSSSGSDIRSSSKGSHCTSKNGDHENSRNDGSIINGRGENGDTITNRNGSGGRNSERITRRNGGYLVTDSDEDSDFDLLRTLRHYRSGRRSSSSSCSCSSSSSSSSSSCSCSSCASTSDCSFFSSEEGPPGGEGTRHRRAAIWLESVKFMLGMLVYGLLAVLVVFTGLGLWVRYRIGGKTAEMGYRIINWTVPLLVVMVVVVVIWQAFWWWLLKHGYGKGDQVLDRRHIISQAKMKGLVYTIRGAVYAPTQPDPRGTHYPARYEVVTHESEYDSSCYFDSDLEDDGQYRRSITPWKEEEDQAKRERRNIYTRKAWFRDVPIVWWELLARPTTDL